MEVVVARRSRTQTTQRIVEALEAVINERGLEGVGVNRIAQQANVSKVLIYRYFGSVDGLMDYYVRLGKLIPVISAEALVQIRPLHKSDLAQIWYRQVIQTYRSFRRSKVAREVLKATLVEHDPMADTVSKAVDEEMTRIVEQLSFVEGADTKAVSAVILGGLSYLTILAQLNRPMIGLDLRNETDWKRIEDAVKLLYIAVNKLANASEEVTIAGQTANPSANQWL